MSHPKAVMWGVIVCFTVIIGVIYYLSVLNSTEWGPPATKEVPLSEQHFTPAQTEHYLDSLKGNSTTTMSTSTQQKAVNSLKATSTPAKNTQNQTQTNQTLDSLKGHK